MRAMSADEVAVEQLWEKRDDLGPDDGDAWAVVYGVLRELDSGRIRVAEVGTDDSVVVHAWIKKAILLSFRLQRLMVTELGPFEYADRLPLKHGYADAGVRVVPGASARFGAYLGPGVVMMPSYVNIGAWVGAGTMVDTWATVGSAAQVGERVHLSGGVGLGGVLEPPQARPVVVGDDVLIGSRAMITEGARVGQGAVIGAGVILNPSIPVIDGETGAELSRGEVPPWCVAIGASRRRELPGGEFFLPCVLVIRRLDEGRRHDKAALEQLLRAHGAAV